MRLLMQHCSRNYYYKVLGGIFFWKHNLFSRGFRFPALTTRGEMRFREYKYISQTICHRRAAEKCFYIARSLARSPDTIQNVIRSSSNMASSPFYTHQLLFLYYIMPHHAYLYVQKSFIYAARKEFLVRMLLLVSPVSYVKLLSERAGMRPASYCDRRGEGILHRGAPQILNIAVCWN